MIPFSFGVVLLGFFVVFVLMNSMFLWRNQEMTRDAISGFIKDILEVNEACAKVILKHHMRLDALQKEISSFDFTADAREIKAVRTKLEIMEENMMAMDALIQELQEGLSGLRDQAAKNIGGKGKRNA
jgi:hypothetical protein